MKSICDGELKVGVSDRRIKGEYTPSVMIQNEKRGEKKMEIKIKKIGYKVGTVGWLAAGIANGSIKIHESTSKTSGKHGLWMKYGENKSMILAIFNPYDLTLNDFADAHRYEVVPRNGDFWCLGDEIGTTDACWGTITEIAQAWVDHITSEREKDKKVNIIIKFEEAA